jgi:hypothetical protein
VINDPSAIEKISLHTQTDLNQQLLWKKLVVSTDSHRNESDLIEVESRISNFHHADVVFLSSAVVPTNENVPGYNRTSTGIGQRCHWQFFVFFYPPPPPPCVILMSCARIPIREYCAIFSFDHIDKLTTTSLLIQKHRKREKKPSRWMKANCDSFTLSWQCPIVMSFGVVVVSKRRRRWTRTARVETDTSTRD